MSDPFIISIHIPKTAGTTLASIFSRCFNRKVIYDYDGYSNPSRALPLIVDNKQFISSYFRVLHGHFYATKYAEVFTDAKFISTVRHPVERVISQFHHELNENSSDAWYHDDIVTGRMDVVTFAAQPGVGDAQALHLSGRPVADYDLLLISENLRVSCGVFEKTVATLNITEFFGVPAVLPKENARASRRENIQVDEKLRGEIYLRTAPDNALYAEACSLMEAKARALNL